MPASRPAPNGLSRRALLAGGAGLALTALAGCSKPSAPPPTTRTLVGGEPFYLASRASARDWPEMTAYAFEQAALIPQIRAMELAVCRSADGVLVCSADPTTDRLTGRRYTIIEEPWATLSGLQVTAAETRDPTQPARPLARLDEILERYIDRFVFFLEPVVKQAYSNLMAAMLQTGHPDRLVWKEPINSPRFPEVKRHGFATWGYVRDEPAHLGDNLDKYASDDAIDILGVSISQKAKLLGGVADASDRHDKPVIAWNIRGRDDLATAAAYGFEGVASLSLREIITIPMPTPSARLSPSASPTPSR